MTVIKILIVNKLSTKRYSKQKVVPDRYGETLSLNPEVYEQLVRGAPLPLALFDARPGTVDRPAGSTGTIAAAASSTP